MEGVREAVLEELARLGVQDVATKKTQHGGRLNFTVSLHPSSATSSKTAKGKHKGKRSPSRSLVSKSPMKVRDERKHTPKSPFSSAKKRAEVRRLNATKENKVFGQGLGQVATVCVYLSGGGEQVKVSQLMVDLCNHIRRSITTEGIFRKAGSAQRQTDLKRLLDGGNSLPSSVHVIDCACLLKQYLRCLPEPLLFPEVHAKMVASMELDSVVRVEAMALSILLLPQTHIDILLYLIDFFSEVVEASSSNKMDARNLAIVLAPNLLSPTLSSPPSLHRKSSHYTDSISTSEDTLLTTNIEILQLLIENSAIVCRMPSYVMETLEPRHRCQSTEDLVSSAAPTHSSSNNKQPHQQPSAPTKKKRRSASIHRLMIGFRRVVGHSRPDPASPVDDPASLDVYPGIALSPLTSVGNSSPRKRKSADAQTLALVESREAGEPCQASPTCKKAKLEDDATCDTKPLVLPSGIPFSHSTSSVKRTDGVGKSKTLNQVATEEPLAKTPSIVLHPFVPVSSSRGRRSVDSLYPPTVCTPFHPIHKTQSQMAGILPTQIATPTTPFMKRRSFDFPLRSGGVKRANTCDLGGQATRRRSSSKTLNEPDGAASWTPGPRGVPDGAECTLRNQPSTSLQALEQHYDDIKSVVRKEEEQLNQSAVHHMRAALFPNISVTSQDLSCSEMIQSAYERMKEETEGQLGVPGPTDTLSRRLGRELKIRNRRSGEHRVIRSPSERRIGTIRQRSKESVQNTAKSLTTADEAASPVPAPAILQTPKMKATLLSTPASASLRRGRPNSVKSGLPLVVRSSATTNHSPGLHTEDSTPGLNSSRLVVVSRREEGSASHEKLLKKTKKYTPHEGDRRNAGRVRVSPNCYQRHRSSIGRSSSDFMESDPSSLSNSFLDEVMGPMTRRRSSLLSLTSPPKLKLSISPQSDEANLDEEWVCAPEYLKAESMDCEEGVGGRPSLAALVKQKKVSSAVQLFNNLHPMSPYASCSSVTKHQHRSRASRRTPRTTMTPRDLLKARGSSVQTPSRVAIVAPLRESKLINIQHEPYSMKTPRGCVPVPMPHNQDSNNPPKLPPRGAIRPSPIRMHVR